MDHHEDCEQFDLAFRCFGRPFCTPHHELQDACPYAIPKRVQSITDQWKMLTKWWCDLLTLQIINTAYSLLRVLDDLGKKERECSSRDLCATSLVETSIIDIGSVWARLDSIDRSLERGRRGQRETGRGRRWGEMVDGGLGGI